VLIIDYVDEGDVINLSKWNHALKRLNIPERISASATTNSSGASTGPPSSPMKLSMSIPLDPNQP